ncbi:hypothetical protein ACFX1Z_030502 [Malus domestica]
MITANQLQILQSPITNLIASVSNSVTVKLDDSDYLQWHFQLQLMLEGYGIMGFVDGTNVSYSVFFIWICKMHDRAFMQLLTVTLSSSAISCAIGSTSSRDLWIRLQEQFSTISRTSIFQMKVDLQNIKKARDFLAAAGVISADEDIVILALNGLPVEYNTFRCVIRGRENVISFKEFRSQLLAEEVTIENTASMPFMSAMMTKNNSQGSQSYDVGNSSSNGLHSHSPTINNGGNFGFTGQSLTINNGGDFGFTGQHGQSNFFNGGNRSKYKGKGKFNNNQGQRYYKPVVHDFAPGILGTPSSYHNGAFSSNVICQICSKHGHSAATCNYRDAEPVEPCQICDKKNHTARTCFFRNKSSNQVPHMAAMNTTHMLSSQMSNFVPLATTTQYSLEVWLTDSGATNHMTIDMRNLSLASPYPVTETVQTANGEGQGHRESYIPRSLQ